MATNIENHDAFTHHSFYCYLDCSCQCSYCQEVRAEQAEMVAAFLAEGLVPNTTTSDDPDLVF